MISQNPKSTIESTRTDTDKPSCGNCNVCKDEQGNKSSNAFALYVQVKDRNISVMGIVLKGAAAAVRARKYPAFRDYVIASIQALGDESYDGAVAIAEKLLKDLGNKNHPINVWMRYTIISKVQNAEVRKLLRSLISKQAKPLKYDLSEADAYLWATILESAAKESGFSLLEIIDKVFTSNSISEGLRVLKEDSIEGLVKFLRDMEAKGQVSVAKVTGEDLKELFKSSCCKPETDNVTTPDGCATSNSDCASLNGVSSEVKTAITANTKPDTV